MRLVVLDRHPEQDARLDRHLGTLEGKGVEHVRIRVPRLDERRIDVSSKEHLLEIVPKWVRPVHLGLVLENLLYLLPSMMVKNKVFKHVVGPEECVLFHVHDPELLGLAKKLKKKCGEGRIVYDRHEVFEKAGGLYGRVARLHELLNGKAIDAVVGISEEHRGGNQRLFPKALVACVPNYPRWSDYDHDVIEGKISSLEENSNILISYVGSLNQTYDRDVLLLLELMEASMSNNHNVKAVVAGRIPSREILNAFEDMESRFGSRFRYIGSISRKESRALTEQSHMGFFLIRPDSKYWVKSSPNKFFEYLVTGNAAVVRADIDYEGGGGVLLFDKNTPKESIIDDVVSLLSDSERLRSFMVASREKGHDHVYEKLEGVYISLYSELCGS